MHYLEEMCIMQSLETAGEYVTPVCILGSLTHVALSGRSREHFEEYVIHLESVRLFKTLDEDGPILACQLLHTLHCSCLCFRPEDFILQHSNGERALDLC